MKMRTILAALVIGSCGAVAACSASGGSSTATCGNDEVEGSEVCDGFDFGGQTCQSMGFGSGSLACALDCKSIDPSGCGAPANCGDNVKDGVEQCDGVDLGGQTCGGLGLGTGTVGCALNCLGFETSGCSGPETCGNGEKDGIEVCDGSDLGGATCESVGAGTGSLTCANNCIDYNTSGCVCAPQCGDLECGVDPVCGQPCGECAPGVMCNLGKCQIQCDLQPILTNTTLDLDAKVVTLTGQVTLNGAQMPNDTLLDGEPRGRLRFFNIETSDSYDITLGESGAANYSVKLFAGTYDVYVTGGWEGGQSVLPGDRRMLLSQRLEVKASSTLNLDAKVLTLSGKVSLNGAQMPNDTLLDGEPRGRMRFFNLETSDSYDVSLGESGAASYSVKMFAGSYDTYVTGGWEGGQTVLPGDRRQRLAKELALSVTTTKDFDAKVLTVSGKVTLNGAQMPNDTLLDSEPRGRMRFFSLDTSDSYDVTLGESGAASYSTTMFAGTYDVYLTGGWEGGQTVLPGDRRQRLDKNLALSVTTTKDFDAKVITVSGKVTLNGAQMPNDTLIDSEPRGRMRFFCLDTSDSYDVNLGETGAAAYSVKLFGGAYDVYLTGGWEGGQTVLPGDRRQRLQKGLALATTTTKDFDAQVLTVSGKVTLNGAQMPNDTLVDSEPRGRLRFFSLDTNDSYDTTLGETGAAAYSVKVFGGSYNVYVTGGWEGGQTVLPGDRRQLLQSSLVLNATTTKDFDAKVVTVSGNVTLNGAQMPNDTLLDGEPRGRLRFFSLDTSDSYDMALGETAAASYSIKLFGGAYNVYVTGGWEGGQTVLPGDRRQLLKKGCPTN